MYRVPKLLHVPFDQDNDTAYVSINCAPASDSKGSKFVAVTNHKLCARWPSLMSHHRAYQYSRRLPPSHQTHSNLQRRYHGFCRDFKPRPVLGSYRIGDEKDSRPPCTKAPFSKNEVGSYRLLVGKLMRERARAGLYFCRSGEPARLGKKRRCAARASR
ncbi:hypothetical protein K461DRAFT_161485 [Myriangium duriaei CBS 260.36]|uniref:Uncharacterized protein n=1 Tax=Myriangium duriaei CBS 260.36 TaxID=1168546 RepID=A0A9P4J0F8_9PEZI|nr:hypothetical protein K461DRAFT_161485 [Myriangium duriaei CBS 260.36]